MPTLHSDLRLSAVKELLGLLHKTEATEVTIERGNIKLHVKRETIASSFQSATTLSKTPTTLISDNQIPFRSTTVTAPIPRDAPFVNEGAMINPNEVVGIIEAMKTMNENIFEEETAGKATRVLVSNGQPVKYDQTLMIAEPTT